MTHFCPKLAYLWSHPLLVDQCVGVRNVRNFVFFSGGFLYLEKKVKFFVLQNYGFFRANKIAVQKQGKDELF